MWHPVISSLGIPFDWLWLQGDGSKPEDVPIDPNEPVYCLCQRVSEQDHFYEGVEGRGFDNSINRQKKRAVTRLG